MVFADSNTADIVIEALKTIAMLGTAAFSFFSWRRSGQAIEGIASVGRKTDQVSAKTDEAVKQVHIIEKATNSMKDALILSTEKEALARGKKEGKEEGRQVEREEFPTGREGTIEPKIKERE